MEAILRFNSKSNEVEMAIQDNNDNITEKIVNINDVIKELQQVVVIKQPPIRIDNFDNGLISFIKSQEKEHYIYRFDERKIKCTFDGKGYSINHPNAIFVIDVEKNRFTKINSYCFKEWKGKNTKLFKYPFPNKLNGNTMCTGTVSREFKTPLETIMNVVEANYTHAHSEFVVKEFKDTKVLFKYLSKNPFPYDVLNSLGYSLGKILEEIN